MRDTNHIESENIKMSKGYESKHWEIEKFPDSLVGELYFTQFYGGEVILEWQLNNNEPNTFWYVSDLLNVEHDCITADNPDDAMEQFEDMIEDHIQDQISFYEDMLEKFKEEKV